MIFVLDRGHTRCSIPLPPRTQLIKESGNGGQGGMAGAGSDLKTKNNDQHYGV